MKSKTLGVIVLTLAIGLCGCGKKSEEASRYVFDDTQQQYQTKKTSGEITDKTSGKIPDKSVSVYTKQPYQTKKISGEIIDIDEDSFAIYSGGYGGANFEIENIRIKGNNGEIYKLVNPGPTSYRIGDKIQDLNFEQLPSGKISYLDLTRGTVISQIGSIEADGIIK